MDTQFIKIDPHRADTDSLKKISKVLEQSGIIVYPTDTFYGLGADCFSIPAIERIYQLKKRERGKAVSVAASGMEMVKACTIDLPPVFSRLAEEFWPGPLTMILKAAPSLPAEILGPGRSLGIRWPDCPWLEELLRITGFPITATSANLSGQSEISTPQKAAEIFNGKVDCIVDGGPTSGGKASSVIDLTGDSPRILREGLVPQRSLLPFWSE